MAHLTVRQSADLPYLDGLGFCQGKLVWDSVPPEVRAQPYVRALIAGVTPLPRTITARTPGGATIHAGCAVGRH